MIIVLSLWFFMAQTEDAGTSRDLLSNSAWIAAPEWLANPSPNVTVTKEGKDLAFRVEGPGRGMKWRWTGLDMATDGWPVLTIRYRADADPTGDYVFWIDDGRPDGWRAILPQDLAADGQWHDAFVDLEAAGFPRIQGFAIQVQTGPRAEAILTLSKMELTAELPVGLAQSLGPAKSVAIQPSAEDWHAKPDWLGNPDLGARVSREGEGIRFAAPGAGQGMKWLLEMKEAVDLAQYPYLSFRYRAHAVARQSDYVLYVAGDGSGESRQEARPFMPSGLIADGAWHAFCARLPGFSAKALAVQVQSSGPEAWMEVADLSLSNRRPRFSLSELMDAEAVSQLDARFVPLRFQTTGSPSSWWIGLSIEDDLPKAGTIRVAGSEFQLPETMEIASTGMEENRPIEIPFPPEKDIPGPFSLHLLMGARFSGEESPSLGGGRLTAVRQPERFVVRVEYEDGVVDEIFPARAGSGLHEIEELPRAYWVAPQRGARIRKAILEDRMTRGSLFLLAASLGPAVAKSEAIEPLPLKPSSRVPLGLSVSGSRVSSIALGQSRTEWVSQPFDLFKIEPNKGIRSDLKVKEGADGEAILTLSLTNEGAETTTLTAGFPCLTGLSPGGDPERLHYCFPKRGAVIGNQPLSLREPYSGRFPLQFMDVWQDGGAGLSVMTLDIENRDKTYWLKKDPSVSLGVEHPSVRLAPGETLVLPSVVLRAHEGDWHAALDAYQRWKATWYAPAVPRKDWFRSVFNFRQQFLHFAMPEKSGLFDPETKTFRFDEVLKKDSEAFGGLDYLHLFDWGWTPDKGRCGDYQPWSFLGSAEAFRSELHRIMDSGIPVGLYIEGYLIDPPSEVAKAHGEAWQLLDSSLKPYTFFAPSFHICSHVKDWQDYLSGAYKKAQSETGAMGFYIDEFGFASHYGCSRPDHGHPVPVTPVRGEEALTRKVRRALPDSCALYTEETPTDVTSQFQDGSFTYAISSVSEEESPTKINLTRFALPDFKTIEIIVCDKPLADDLQSLKRIFFNGEAIWLEGIPEKCFSPESLAFIRKMHGILRENVEAFTSLTPRPLVPTLSQELYANAFPYRGTTVWTFFNAGWQTFRGQAISVAHVSGARYIDLWSGQEIDPEVKGDQALLPVTLGPRDVGAVLQKGHPPRDPE